MLPRVASANASMSAIDDGCSGSTKSRILVSTIFASLYLRSAEEPGRKAHRDARFVCLRSLSDTRSCCLLSHTERHNNVRSYVVRAVQPRRGYAPSWSVDPLGNCRAASHLNSGAHLDMGRCRCSCCSARNTGCSGTFSAFNASAEGRKRGTRDSRSERAYGRREERGGRREERGERREGRRGEREGREQFCYDPRLDASTTAYPTPHLPHLFCLLCDPPATPSLHHCSLTAASAGDLACSPALTSSAVRGRGSATRLAAAGRRLGLRTLRRLSVRLARPHRHAATQESQQLGDASDDRQYDRAQKEHNASSKRGRRCGRRTRG